MVDFFIALGEIALIISYLFRDILYLRLVTIVGLIGYVVAGFVGGINAEGMKALIVFNGLGVIINIIQIILIFRDRKSIFMPQQARQVYDYGFQTIQPYTFYKKIYKSAYEKVFHKNDQLAIQDKPIQELMIILDGAVEVVREQQVMTTLDKGFFIGEMSFLANENASATVNVISDKLTTVCWNKEDLQKINKKNPELYARIQQVIALHLIKKLKR